MSSLGHIVKLKPPPLAQEDVTRSPDSPTSDQVKMSTSRHPETAHAQHPTLQHSMQHDASGSASLSPTGIMIAINSCSYIRYKSLLLVHAL